MDDPKVQLMILYITLGVFLLIYIAFLFRWWCRFVTGGAGIDIEKEDHDEFETG